MFKLERSKIKMKKNKRITPFLLRKLPLTIFSVFSVLVVGFSVVPHIVRADSYDEQIKQLQAENNNTQSTVDQLADQASSYQDAINRLQAQIDAVQAQINDNQTKQTDLQGKIDTNQVELDKQKNILGENIRVMYVEGQISTIEMLATSKNLSDFVDKEEYHTAVENKIQDTLKRINDLQNQLKEQKTQVEKLLADQKSQQDQLDASKSQQDQLLAYNASQQAGYNSQINANKSKISDLHKQQAAENARLFSGSGSHIVAGNNGNDTYPNKWRSAGQDTVLDNWGMYNRECVSYTAWKVYESGRYMPYWGGHGNANQWDDNARAAGIPVDSNPRVGDVAIKNSQPYGHAMYVEHVYSDGGIYVSQYNASLDGTYSEAVISASTVRSMGLQFIHF
jgi:peptidoglycan hydrolase CwlO-like protein